MLGHLIIDSILIAYEVLHSLSTRLKSKKRFMALKINMSKAYDRIEWDFIKSVLLKMGFHLKWVTWVMDCVLTVNYSILINVVPYKCSKPSRGIPQGDRLSSYLLSCV